MNRLPSFLCVGTQKAGTSWLYENLRYHPGVWMPPLKELHYFDHLYCKSTRSWSRWHVRQGVGRLLKQSVQNSGTIDFAYVRYLLNMVTEPMFSELWYEQIFHRPAARGKVLGDITPEYCGIGDEGIGYVKHLLGDVKIIWLVRDPIDRALSQIRMNAERRGLSGDVSVQEWMELADTQDVLNRGDYENYIPKWEHVFGREGILFLPFKWIITQPELLLQAVETFIGVEVWGEYPAPDKKIHATRDYDLPEQVSGLLSERLQKQYQFLNAYFDANFVTHI